MYRNVNQQIESLELLGVLEVCDNRPFSNIYNDRHRDESVYRLRHDDDDVTRRIR